MKKVQCEVYSRIVGYFRPIENWNIGKKKEFEQRVEYDIKLSKLKNTPLTKACETCN